MRVDDEYLFPLLDRYLAGEASAAEGDVVREWLSDDPEHALLLEDLRVIRRAAAERAPESSTDAAWARAALELAPRKHRRRRLFSPARVAAAVALAVIGSVLWQTRYGSETREWREYATDAAQRAVIRLRDGTQISLAPESRVRYPADYGVAARDVHLEGEAYFEVIHDGERPFRVHTRRSVTEDLGTAFVVKAYGDEVATEVVVTQGRVTVRRADTTTVSRDSVPGTAPGLVLAAGDLGRLDLAGVATIQHGVDVGRYVAWTRGMLVFNGTPLGEVVRALERWYNVEVRLADDALASRRLTATFDNEPVTRVLERIALTLALRVEPAGGSVLLRRSDLQP
jgi:transmembrane sensor